MKLFDTHAHINDNRFDNDRADMLQACFDAGSFLVPYEL